MLTSNSEIIYLFRAKIFYLRIDISIDDIIYSSLWAHARTA